MKALSTYFDHAIEAGASDVHLVAGEPAMIRIAGQLELIDDTPLSAKELETAIMGLLSADQKKRYTETLELDLAYEHHDDRFRINIHQQQGQIGMAARHIPKDIPQPEDLRFEPALMNFPNLLDGLVLLVGPTGSGKSTTLASIVEQINLNRKAHIITIEDPIEFTFENKQSLVEQREVGVDTHSFAAALKHVLRQDPDVILVGEMRDPETIATVLTAAETGHLVFSTLHTSTAAEAVERIVDVFDGPKQKQILIQLASVMRGIVAQQLVPTVDGSRIAAREIMINTPAVSNLIRENNIAQLRSVVQTGAREGMVTMENALKALEKEGLIDQEVIDKRSSLLKTV
jgi:twitching motility protein PilT